MTRTVLGIAAGACALSLPVLAADHTKDSTAAVKKAVEAKKAVLIDVREADEWKEGHLRDAQHLALSEIKAGVSKEKLKAFFPQGKVVYLHCAAGGRCLKAADVLNELGVETRPLKPGYEALLEAGFPKAK